MQEATCKTVNRDQHQDQITPDSGWRFAEQSQFAHREIQNLGSIFAKNLTWVDSLFTVHFQEWTM